MHQWQFSTRVSNSGWLSNGNVVSNDKSGCFGELTLLICLPKCSHYFLYHFPSFRITCPLAYFSKCVRWLNNLLRKSIFCTNWGYRCTCYSLTLLSLAFQRLHLLPPLCSDEQMFSNSQQPLLIYQGSMIVNIEQQQLPTEWRWR